jgi:hypothetical protein
VTAAADLVRRRVSGTYAVDEWGLDADLVAATAPVLGLRWSVDVAGAEHVPAAGPVLLVANRRFGVSEPFVVALGLGRETGRHVRPLGVPDVAPAGPLLRRLGGVLDRPDELAGLLRAGEVALAFCGRLARPRHRAGPVPPATVVPAVGTGAPVVPVAVVGREAGRRWRVVVGPPVPTPAARGPLAAVELAEAARGAVQDLLDDAVPPRRLFR